MRQGRVATWFSKQTISVSDQDQIELTNNIQNKGETRNNTKFQSPL